MTTKRGHASKSGRRTIAWLLMLVLTITWLGAGGPASLAAIILSEVMYDPQNSDSNREWVEVFNNGTASQSLAGWQFGLPGANDWTTGFASGTTLGAGQAMVLTPNSSVFDSDWGTGKNRIQVGNFPSLPNDPSATAGRIAIRNSSGAIQDEISYRNENGWPRVNGNDGASIYVLPQHLTGTANDNGGNWRPSSNGLYGAYYRAAGGDSENHASPGYVATQQQAPFAPSADAVWSMVIMPDIQNYTSRNDSHLNILKGQTQWIKDHKDDFNIQVVLQEGDITNSNSNDSWWANAREGMSTLDGVVPYIMSTGNHDYNTQQAGRNTQFNTYFKASQNPLVNPATGGILVDTMDPGRLENAYFEFEAPDGRDMLIFSLEFWPRNSVLTWAKDVAQQPEYANHTAVVLSHAILNSNDDWWRAGEEAYVMDGGNDGLDIWNKLLDVGGNFEMSFNGHVGGDGQAYRKEVSNAGDDVHIMELNAQFEANGGNGWLRVLEFLDDGRTVRVRTYSPHFNLYRTNAASSFNFTLSQIVEAETPLVWNVNSGAAVGFTDGFATGDGDQGVGVFPASPWDSQYNDGTQTLMVGYNGNATFSGSGSRTIGSMRIGTNQADTVIAGRNGNGAITTSNSVNLTVASTSESSGDFIVGEGGYSGTANWGSSGTLEVQGKLRVGQGGVGTFNQAAGVVIGGNAAGSFKFIGIGVDAGGNGTYNLDGGFLRPSGGFAGTEFRQTLVGDNEAIGTLNVGNNVGATNTAVLESNDDLIVGRNGGTGTLRVRNDGRVELRTSSNPAEFRVGQSATGTVIQTGGSVVADDIVLIGSGEGGVGQYTISGGSLNTATDGSGSFRIAHAGATGTLRVSGASNVNHGAELYIAAEVDTGGIGRLEIIGSGATIQIGQLENDAGGESGLSETIRWEASALGISPIVVAGTGPAAQHVQLQDLTELAANTGAGATLAGDGIALSLDLSLLSGTQTLTLIDNRSSQAITGYFEDASTGDLFQEGSTLAGTGFDGAVTISYIGSSGVGSTGNDVVLNLVADSGEDADFDQDGDVDGADFLTWQRNVETTSGASIEDGDANDDGAVNGDDLEIWSGQVGAASATAQLPVPEPGSLALIFAAACGAAVRRQRTSR